MKSAVFIFLALVLFPVLLYAQKPETEKIWDKGGHNAFTDLIRFKSYFYCTFREGISHVPKDTAENGKIRVLRSADLKNWESVALLANRRYDLRDPKLSVTPDNKLMVLMGGSHYVSGKLVDMMPHVSFSTEGIVFTHLVPVSIEANVRTRFDWIWRVTWNENAGYGIVYQSQISDNNYKVRLLKTTDGISYRQVTEFNIESLPNEATIRFDENDNMIILLRREAKANGFIGISFPPYLDWKWKDLGYRLGGPDFLVLRNKKMVVGTRLYKPESTSTVIYLTDREGNILKTIQLPSGGDTSYPGLLLYKKLLLVSYYSSHEGKTSVYLSQIRIKDLLKD